MTFPVFASGDVLNASDMNGVGLWLVKTQTVGSGVSSVAVTGAFSADYDNYIVTYSGGSASDTNISMRLGAATTGYFGSLVFGNYAAATVTGANDNNTAQFNFCGGGGTFGTCYIEVLQPFLTTNTEIRARVRYATVYGTYVGHRGDTVSYSGFTLAPGTGTLTGGTIRVYGYRN
jgi:hypothetical protein